MPWVRADIGGTYCIAEDLLIFADKRVVLDYLSDDGEPVEESELLTDPTQSENEFNTRMLGLMRAASQRIVMACRRGQKYTLAALQAIYEDESRPESERASRQYQIIPLAVNLTVGMLVARRVLSIEEVFKLAPFYKEALEMLDELKAGSLIFDDFEEQHAEAGVDVRNIEISSNVVTWSRCAQRLFGSPGCCGGGYPNVGGYSFPPSGNCGC